MERDKLLQYIAPCSLLCYTCMGLRNGPIAECAKTLHNLSEGISEFFSAHTPEEKRHEQLAFFTEFRNALQNFSGAFCPGCRNNSASCPAYEGCVIPACVQERGIDFCAQCNEFPCPKVKDYFDAHDELIYPVWVNGNKRIREVGIEAYFEEKKDVSHYIHYGEN